MSEPRRCTHPGCDTILSRFNDTDTCWPHRSPDAGLMNVGTGDYKAEVAKIRREPGQKRVPLPLTGVGITQRREACPGTEQEPLWLLDAKGRRERPVCPFCGDACSLRGDSTVRAHRRPPRVNRDMLDKIARQRTRTAPRGMTQAEAEALLELRATLDRILRRPIEEVA